MATVSSPRRPPPPAPSAEPAETVADLLRRLGNIPARRVRLHPTPGTATERDLIAANEDKFRTALYELVDGTLVEKPMGLEESGIAALLIMFLNSFVHPRRLGLVTAPHGPFRIESGSIRLPDISFFARASQPGGKDPKGPIAPVAPALAVEVLSKSNTKAEIARKLDEYFASGTRLAWIVDPKKQSVRVHTSPTVSTLLKGDAVLDGGDVLPGFQLPLTDLFPEPRCRFRHAGPPSISSIGRPTRHGHRLIPPPTSPTRPRPSRPRRLRTCSAAWAASRPAASASTRRPARPRSAT